jgi:peptidyl-prolyl cis-trans isomerase A (cyclophilin A)
MPMPTPRAALRRRPSGARVLAACLLTALPALAPGVDAPGAAAASRVRVDTTLGSFVVQLETARAPLTSANFLAYVKGGFYTGTIFHRVINNFVVQGGGYDEKYQLKTPLAPVPNESGSGLSNKRGTLGLARSDAPHSGNAQFYVNLTDNDDLDPTPLRWGYAVFGRVVDGMEVVDRIGRTPTGTVGPWTKDAPLEPVVIKRIELIPDTAAPAPAAAAPAAPPPPR